MLLRLLLLLICSLVVVRTEEVRGEPEEELRRLLEAALDRHLPPRGETGREAGAEEGRGPVRVGAWLVGRHRARRQVQSAPPGALMYLPVGGSGSVRCPTAADAAAVSIAQMTFLATSMNILSIVANINNNLNNNNNNNNQLNINAQSNNNVVTNTNVNHGNQVNVMVPVLNP
jgi:hypothetical protein